MSDTATRATIWWVSTTTGRPLLMHATGTRTAQQFRVDEGQYGPGYRRLITGVRLEVVRYTPEEALAAYEVACRRALERAREAVARHVANLEAAQELRRKGGA